MNVPRLMKMKVVSDDTVWPQLNTSGKHASGERSLIARDSNDAQSLINEDYEKTEVFSFLTPVLTECQLSHTVANDRADILYLKMG